MKSSKLRQKDWKGQINCASLDEALAGAGAPPRETGAAVKGSDAGSTLTEAVETVYKEFNKAMDDDFNTALATAALFDFCKAVNSYLHVGAGSFDYQLLKSAREVFSVLAGDVLGILFETSAREGDKGEDAQMIEQLMQLLLDIREDARGKKDWATADVIRDRLGELGIEIQDTPQGPKWSAHVD